MALFAQVQYEGQAFSFFLKCSPADVQTDATKTCMQSLSPLKKKSGYISSGFTEQTDVELKRFAMVALSKRREWDTCAGVLSINNDGWTNGVA